MLLLMILKSIKKTNPSMIGMWSSTANIFKELFTLFSDIWQTPIRYKFEMLRQLNFLF